MESTVGAAHVEMVGCTTVSTNYLAYARVLAVSWRLHHPTAPFVVLVLDGDSTVAPADRPREVGDAEIVLPDEIGLDVAELLVRRGMYGPLELATSLKPHLLATLLDRGHEAAVFVDPDSRLYGPVDDLGTAAATHGVALLPHVLGPVPLDGCSPTEIELQDTGVFNTGLLAVGKQGEPFLRWWAERLRRDCVIDRTHGLFVDQRWADWVPSYFPHVVVRDPTLNVAYWNLHERPLAAGPEGPTIEGQPLRHFHFSGFEPTDADVLTSYARLYPRPLRVGPDPQVDRLCRDYGAAVLAADHAELSAGGYRGGRTPSGVPLTADQRAAYRLRVLAAERRGVPTPLSPMDPAAPAMAVAAPFGLSRLLRRGPAGTQSDGSGRRGATGASGRARLRFRRAERHLRTLLRRAR